MKTEIYKYGFVDALKENTGCKPINSREEQIVTLFKERIDKLSKEYKINTLKGIKEDEE